MIPEDNDLNEFDADDLNQFLESETIKPQPITTPVVQTDTTATTMDKSKYAATINVLKFLNGACDDLLIKNGRILQVNAPRSLVFDIDVTPVFGAITLPMSNIATKLTLLSLFRSQNVDVAFEQTTESYSFQDSKTKFKFSKVLQSFINNEQWNQQQLEKNMDINKSKLILSCKLEKMILSRIETISAALGANTYRILFNGNKANLSIIPGDSSHTTVAEVMTFSDELNDTSLSDTGIEILTQSIVSFISAGIEDIDMKIYHRNTEDLKVVMVLTSKFQIGSSDESMPVSVYALGRLMSKTELERNA